MWRWGCNDIDNVTNWDDGNLIDGDGCSSAWVIESGYRWYGGTTSSPDTWYTVWGDGYITYDEQWDDGGVASDDGCDALWALETGFDWTHNNTSPHTVCADTCGDGKVFAGTPCDDNNSIDGDGCSQSCTIETGYIWENGTQSTASQWYEEWGDGLDFETMEWDDGNIYDNDGWDSNCELEEWYIWTGGTSSNADSCEILHINATISDVSADHEITVSFDYDMNETEITLNDMNIEIDADYMIYYSWQAQYEDSRTLKIDISINDILKGSEKITVKMNNWKTFSSLYGGWVQPEILYSTMPNSLAVSVKAVEDASLKLLIIMYWALGLNILLVSVIGGSLETMWWTLNLLQIISFIPLMLSYFPQHVQIMFNLVEFANMDFEILSQAFTYLIGISDSNLSPYNDRYEENGVESTLFLDIWASLILSIILTALYLIGIILMFYILRWEKIKNKLESILNSYFFDYPLRFLIEGFLEISFGCLINITSFSSKSGIEVISFLISCLTLMFFIFIVWVISAILYDKQKELYDEDSIYRK